MKGKRTFYCEIAYGIGIIVLALGTALMEKAKTMSITQLNDLLRQLLPLLTTDMSDAEIMSLAMDIFPILDELELKTQQIPAEGTYRMSMVNGMSVLIPDLTANGEILAEIVAE